MFRTLMSQKSFILAYLNQSEVDILATWVNIVGIFCYVRLDDLASVSVFAETAQTQTDEHSVSQSGLFSSSTPLPISVSLPACRLGTDQIFIRSSSVRFCVVHLLFPPPIKVCKTLARDAVYQRCA